MQVHGHLEGQPDARKAVPPGDKLARQFGLELRI